MGKTALGWTFAETVPHAVWLELEPGADLETFAGGLARTTGVRASDPDRSDSVAEAIGHISAGNPQPPVRGGDREGGNAGRDPLATVRRRRPGQGQAPR